MRQSNGTVVVADLGALQVKYYAPDGRLQRTVGRKGRGPEEFEYISYLWACGGDSAFVEDLGDKETNVLDPDGRLVRRFVIQGPAPNGAYSTACNRRGMILTTGWGDLRQQKLGAQRRPVPAAFNSNNGTRAAVIGTFPGTEMFGRKEEGYPRRLGRWLRIAMGDSLGWIAPNETDDILGYDTTGTLRVVIRPTAAEPALTARDRAWFDSLALDSAHTPRDRSDVRRQLQEDDYPERPPAVAEMLGDATGHLWVRPHPRARTPNPAWRVYRSDGSWLSTVQIPPQVSVREIGNDYVLGITTGTDGGHRLVGFRLRKPSPQT